jgi:hypothetical protein
MSIKKKILNKALANDDVLHSSGDEEGKPRKRNKTSDNANVIPGRNVV